MPERNLFRCVCDIHGTGRARSCADARSLKNPCRCACHSAKAVQEERNRRARRLREARAAIARRRRARSPIEAAIDRACGLETPDA